MDYNGWNRGIRAIKGDTMKFMNLTFEDKDKDKLDKAKEECERKRKQKLSWEE